MKYPTIRIKALGNNRRFEVLPAVEGFCFSLDFKDCRFLNTNGTCGDAFKICSEFPVIFKEIFK